MIVTKEWGYEEYLADQETYTGKRLHIKLNKMSSIHCHLSKTETFVCESGLIHVVTYFVQEHNDMLHLEANPTLLTPSQAITINPETWHSFYCGTSGSLLEFSDKHRDEDVFRLKESQSIDYPPNLDAVIKTKDTDWGRFKTLLSI
jgi:D-lyxose ketol-isomerase